MSDQFLVIIPADPNAPLPKSAGALRDALAGIVVTDEARVKDYGKLQFIDCGENAEAIRCASCGAEIIVETWHAWMDEDWHGEEGFHLHRHDTPCCGRSITLNDLEYHHPQGFARWFVGARADNASDVTAENKRLLEAIAGLELRVIRQRY